MVISGLSTVTLLITLPINFIKLITKFPNSLVSHVENGNNPIAKHF